MKKKIINIVIFGVSGHAKVIVDIIKNENKYNIIGFIDNNKPKGTKVNGFKVLGNDSELTSLIKVLQFSKGIIGIGDNYLRYSLSNKIKASNPKFEFINCIHPYAYIGNNVQIGQGNVVMPGVIINASAVIKNHCILNTNSSIDHDSIMMDYSSLAPNATIGGNSEIGEYSAVGLGASIFHKIQIANNCIIGGGTVVTKNTKENAVYFGNPAKYIKPHKFGNKYL